MEAPASNEWVIVESVNVTCFPIASYNVPFLLGFSFSKMLFSSFKGILVIGARFSANQIG
jgi:hypothetical protein